MLRLIPVFLSLVLYSACAPRPTESTATADAPPNIILILADDLGYGDPGSYNSESKIPTPHIDALAARGMRFTDAHTTSAVCTPTRYGILTGQYSWRGPLKQGVTWSYDSLIIDTSMATVADVLDRAGYRTACVGKWHLGLGWQTDSKGTVRFDQPLTTGPTDLGFDSFYGIAASLDIPPYVYLRDHQVVQQPTDSTAGTATGYFDDFWRMGPVSPDFDHYETLNHLTARAEEVIRDGADHEAPFFLYFPLTAPHLPWIPHPEFQGRSGVANYGDLTVEVDHVVGRITALVDSLGIADNTLVVLTSDNGSQLSSELMTQYAHRANGPWRGRKGDVYEGGHRVPFIVSWPGRIEAGSTSEGLVSTTDFYATFAELVGQPLPGADRRDSQSFLSHLRGGVPPIAIGATGSANGGRKAMVYHSAKGLFALRSGSQVYVAGRGSGGFLEVPDTTAAEPPYQLYDLSRDPSQQRNLADAADTTGTRLRAELLQVIAGH